MSCILWSVFANDFCLHMHDSVRMIQFADDTQIWTTGKVWELPITVDTIGSKVLLKAYLTDNSNTGWKWMLQIQNLLFLEQKQSLKRTKAKCFWCRYQVLQQFCSYEQTSIV